MKMLIALLSVFAIATVYAEGYGGKTDYQQQMDKLQQDQQNYNADQANRAAARNNNSQYQTPSAYSNSNMQNRRD